MMDKRYLVIYDIADGKRLARAATIVLDYGVRVQKSVYEVRLTKQSLTALQHRLARVINPEVDGVKIFPLCDNCLANRTSSGASLPQLPAMSPWLVI